MIEVYMAIILFTLLVGLAVSISGLSDWAEKRSKLRNETTLKIVETILSESILNKRNEKPA